MPTTTTKTATPTKWETEDPTSTPTITILVAPVHDPPRLLRPIYRLGDPRVLRPPPVRSDMGLDSPSLPSSPAKQAPPHVLGSVGVFAEEEEPPEEGGEGERRQSWRTDNDVDGQLELEP
ncbi:hypothetical protein B0H12DRAFT_1228995 [Mycena haematopus]|nr:hypothetical protein B0H12DRAFT_1228995 [Mycena haematopus]